MELSPWLIQTTAEISHGQGQRDWVPGSLSLLSWELPPLVSWFGEEKTQAWSPDPLSPQAQRPGVPQFPPKDGLSHEEKGEREEAEEDSYLKLCAPRVTATSQSQLQKIFRATDTVGKSPALAGG